MDDDPSHLSIVRKEPATALASTDAYTPFAEPEKAIGLVGNSSAMGELRRQIRRFATSRSPVLVTGDSGTGKELVARALHAGGDKANAPFVAVNAACLKGSLLQSELFGHERGAFTGAIAPRRGLFELADRGTLFIDEIGELDVATQAELLRVLECGEVRPVGAERARRVCVRVVAATHRDLPEMVSRGTFREDLLYRLRVLVIRVPPLADRDEDVPALVDHLLGRLVPAVGRRTIVDEAIIRLADEHWPGNVRQLLHVIERACVLTDAVALSVDDIERALEGERTGTSTPGPGNGGPSDAAIQTALQMTKGSISGAARMLRIARSTLRDRMARMSGRVS